MLSPNILSGTDLGESSVSRVRTPRLSGQQGALHASCANRRLVSEFRLPLLQNLMFSSTKRENGKSATSGESPADRERKGSGYNRSRPARMRDVSILRENSPPDSLVSTRSEPTDSMYRHDVHGNRVSPTQVSSGSHA